MRGMYTILGELRLYFCLSLVLLLLLPTIFALEQDTSIFQSEELLINQTITTKIDLSLAQSSSLNWITANFSFLPFSSPRQQVLTQQFYPDVSKRGEDWVEYKWTKPKEGELWYSVSHVIRTKNKYAAVTGKVKYPVLRSSYDSSILVYTKPTELIDINAEITAKAKELAGSSTDLFEVTFAIADWVTSNIEYDLNTITADASQKATWVLDTRTGVCDELSTLFMAMMRSLDIPVRFVSGVSYTTSSLFEQPWNAHAWTEVYFPNHGWVPFDLTYNQFGYIDASHIKLKVSNDADDSTTTYLWEGHNLPGVDVKLHDLKFENVIVSTTGKIESDINVSARLLKSEVGFGSYNMIELKLTNLASHYVADTFFFASAKEISFLETNGHVPILLKPLQTKYVYIPFKIAASLDKRSKYTMPISYYDLQSNSGLLKLTTHSLAHVYGLADMRVLSVTAEELASSVNELDSYSLGCSPDVKTVFVNESLSIVCFVEQTKQTSEPGEISICFLNECKVTQFEKNVEVIFERTFSQIGEVEGIIQLQIGNKQKKGKFATVVNDKAVLKIQDLTAPASLSYGESLNLTFLIKKESFAQAEDVTVRVGRAVPSVWKFGTVSLDQSMTVLFTSEQMIPGTNTFEVTISYFDGETVQSVTDTISVELVDVPFFTRIWLYFLDLFA